VDQVRSWWVKVFFELKNNFFEDLQKMKQNLKKNIENPVKSTGKPDKITTEKWTNSANITLCKLQQFPLTCVAQNLKNNGHWLWVSHLLF
jgi:hypothetical protein